MEFTEVKPPTYSLWEWNSDSSCITCRNFLGTIPTENHERFVITLKEKLGYYQQILAKRRPDAVSGEELQEDLHALTMKDSPYISEPCQILKISDKVHDYDVSQKDVETKRSTVFVATRQEGEEIFLVLPKGTSEIENIPPKWKKVWSCPCLKRDPIFTEVAIEDNCTLKVLGRSTGQADLRVGTPTKYTITKVPADNLVPRVGEDAMELVQEKLRIRVTRPPKVLPWLGGRARQLFKQKTGRDIQKRDIPADLREKLRSGLDQVELLRDYLDNKPLPIPGEIKQKIIQAVGKEGDMPQWAKKAISTSRNPTKTSKGIIEGRIKETNSAASIFREAPTPYIENIRKLGIKKKTVVEELAPKASIVQWLVDRGVNNNPSVAQVLKKAKGNSEFLKIMNRLRVDAAYDKLPTTAFSPDLIHLKPEVAGLLKQKSKVPFNARFEAAKKGETSVSPKPSARLPPKGNKNVPQRKGGKQEAVGKRPVPKGQGKPVVGGKGSSGKSVPWAQTLARTFVEALLSGLRP